MTSRPRARADRVVGALAQARVALGFRRGGGGAAAVGADVARPGRAGLVVALAGEALRVWAAGHLEKSREVTRSGPYRWTRHPLYVGSSVIALGVVIASNSVVVAVLAAVYMVATIDGRDSDGRGVPAAGRSATPTSATSGRKREPMERRFSVERAMRNREYRAAAGARRRASRLLRLKAAAADLRLRPARAARMIVSRRRTTCPREGGACHAEAAECVVPDAKRACHAEARGVCRAARRRAKAGG